MRVTASTGSAPNRPRIPPTSIWRAGPQAAMKNRRLTQRSPYSVKAPEFGLKKLTPDGIKEDVKSLEGMAMA